MALVGWPATTSGQNLAEIPALADVKFPFQDISDVRLATRGNTTGRRP
jgi:hypothetical protein